MIPLAFETKFLQLKAPVADAFAGNVVVGPVVLANFGDPTFLINLGVGSTGRSKIQAFAYDDVVGTNKAAIGCWARTGTGQDPDKEGLMVRYSSGVDLNPLAVNFQSTQIVVQVSKAEAVAALNSAKAVALHFNEYVDAVVVGSVTAVMPCEVSRSVQLNGLVSGIATYG